MTNRRRRATNGSWLPVALALAVVVVVSFVAGCGPSPSPTAAPVGSATAASLSAAASAAQASTPGTSATRAPAGGSPAGSAEPSPSGDVSVNPTRPPLVDPSLLAILPATVDGLPLGEDVPGELDQAARLKADPTVAAYAAAVVGDAGENVATISLVRPTIPTDVASFATRFTQQYDAAACEANGGVALSSSNVIGGRRTEITRCNGGAVLYHVTVGRTVVSILELGPLELGRRVIAGLSAGG